MNLRMTFYGTGAAEGIPSPFCACRVCQNARRQGGREIRRRTMLRISDEICIDLGADSFMQALEYGDFTGLRHVLVTHTHEDHLAHMMMNVRGMATERDEEPLHFYFTGEAYKIVDFYRGSSPLIKGKTRQLEEEGVVAFHRLEFMQETEIGGFGVLPLRGNHTGNVGERSANYLIRLPDGRRFYYGLDTGWYLDETFAALEGARLDLMISECTYGLTPGRGPHPDSHLDAYSCAELIRRLDAQNTLRPGAPVYLTHINHRTSTGAQLIHFFEGKALPHPVTVAWDGMRIPL